ncbi:MAG: GGDEF domain-containing protein [Dehalococcoidia bacterium]|nr:GGDEF domain-containing protein [Dehalococcoidia bacterium]
MQWSASYRSPSETGNCYACGRDITERIAEVEDSERLSRYTQVLESSHNEMRQALEQSNQDANSDSLTGLLNRRGFEQAAAGELSRASRHRHSFGIAIFDIDYFKQVNDRHGHAVGDAVLIEVARRLDSNRRQYDLVGRWGGEEFVALFPETDLNNSRQAAERLALAIGARQIVTDNIKLRITISAGVVAVPDGTTGSLPDLVAAADEALTRAKENGRDRVEVGVLGAE